MDGERRNRTRPAGGPKTAAGKQASRKNALKHGLTSKKLLPEVLRVDQVTEYRRKFEAQFQPGNPTESILVAELARHAAMMDIGQQAEGAVLRHGARELSKVILNPQGTAADDDHEREDAVLSAAVSTDALDKFNRYRRGHEKAFYAALNKLREIQSDRTRQEETGEPQGSGLAETLDTEQACEEYLRERFHHADWRCPRCGHARGSWLKQPKRWECNGCHRQIGLRCGTVMQGSRLPLRIWFRAITEMLKDGNAVTSSLVRTLGIQRRDTVRRMKNKIADAIATDNKSKLLAGLDKWGSSEGGRS